MAGFTPAFNQAFRNLTRLAQTTPEELVAKHKRLKPERRFQDIQQKFRLFQNLPQSSDNISKMTAFLKAVNDTVESNELAADLEEINTIQAENEKFAALKEVFKKEQTLRAFAQCWEMYLKSESTPMEEIEKRFEEVSEGSHQAMEALDSQSRFDAVKKTVQEVMRLFYALFDALLISAGYKDVFVPNHGGGQDAGALDPKHPGIYRNQRGMYTL